MRWRYLILGVLLAGPTAEVVYFWPQMPVYSIPNGDGRCYIGDDVANRQLLFLIYDRQHDFPPAIERYSADSGRLVSSARLDLTPREIANEIDSTHRVSDDASTLCWRRFVRGKSDGEAVFFDTTNGQRRGLKFDGVSPDFGLAPHGKWFWWFQQYPSFRLNICEINNLEPVLSIPFPSEVPMVHCAVDPEGKALAYQRVVNNGGRFDLEPVAHIVSVDGRREELTVPLPISQKLSQWRSGELRTEFGSQVQGNPFDGRSQVQGNPFDGRRVTFGAPDPLLESNRVGQNHSLLCGESSTWIARVSTFQPERSAAIITFANMMKTWFGIELFGTDNDRVTIFDRRSNKIRFELTLPSCLICRVAIDGAFVVAIGVPETNPNTFVYRTDLWPRWIWSSLAVGGLLAAFALLGRWRHVVIRRRGQAPPLAATRA